MDPERLQREIEQASSVLKGRVVRTPVEKTRFDTESGTVDCFLKLENLQKTGSFKFRGAVNRLFSLSEEERQAGVVAASTGNHGAAVACAAEMLGMEVTIFAPHTASAGKINNIKRYGGTIEFSGRDCVESERHARRYATSCDAVFVSPYNDPWIIAGQGTIGLELIEDEPGLDAVFIALGGGGLMSGVGAALKKHKPDLEVVACSPENSPVMYESLKAGQILDFPSKPTLSDGTAGGVEEDAITFPLCRSLIDRHVLVSEGEIAAEMTQFINEFHMLAEGAAGVAQAGFKKIAKHYAGKRVAIIVCGGNVDTDTLKKVLCESPAPANRSGDG